ncbi:MAG: hypothetical protein ACYCVD_06800 [Desulfitobacteriaceae bacterium]
MSEMQEILQRLTAMGEDIRDIKADVRDIKADVAELKTRVGNLEVSVEQIKTRQEFIFEQTAGLMEFRTETKTILKDIQNSQISISEILGEHEINIRGLRRRLV